MDTLAEKSNFLEIAYLLWYGELPTKIEWGEFSDAIKTPEEVAALAAFLAAPESGFITGQVYTVDGGRMAQLSLP